jgi:hypothetical protein
MYKPEQPLAYEYAGDIGNLLERLETEYKIPPLLPEAVALQSLAGQAAQQAMKAAGMGGLELINRGMMGEGPLRNYVPQHQFVINPTGGGNWLKGSVESGLKPLRRQTAGRSDPAEMLGRMRERYTPEEIEKLQNGLSRTHVLGTIAELEKDVALNNWVDRNLSNYVKKQMATPEDPVRKLAEQGIVHIPSEQVGVNRYRAPKHREAYGGEQLGKSEAARAWEDASDVAINAPRARTIKENESLYQANPWIEKLSPEDRVYALNRPASTQHEISGLGFDHIMDVLREDLASGRIRPEQLSKVSMEQAVRRAFEYDQELAAKMNAARNAQREGLPVYKEYPEGFRWVELNKPGSFASESEAMGHSVRGYEPPVGHPDWVEGSGDAGSLGYGHGGWEAIKSGKAKVYSLVDSKGQPHTTVEVKAGKPWNERSGIFYDNPELEPSWQRFSQEASLEEKAKGLNRPSNYIERYPEWLKANDPEVYAKHANVFEESPPLITQIKGKQNRAPKEDYLPYVQDFVKSGNWSDVGDLGNTGLYSAKDVVGYMPEGFTMSRNARQLAIGRARQANDLPDYMTRPEYEAMLLKHAPEDIWAAEKAQRAAEDDNLLKQLRPPEGMKRGGVAISHNPDAMMLELNNQKMKNGVPAYGGAGAVIKQGLKAAKPPKIDVPIRFPVSRGPTVPEIRAMAERMAPQVMGEFVRAAPTPSNPKPSTSVVGKTQKQFEREKTLPIEYENIKEPVTPQEFDYAQKKGALLIGAQGDVTPGNRMLVSIDEQPLSVPVHLQAGPEWELYNPSAWAATDQMAKTWMNRAGKAAEAYDADPYLHYHKMTPDANFYAMHHLNSVLGHLRPEELKLRDPKLYQQMVEEIRTRDVGFGKHPEFEGFEDPLNLQVHAQMDPNFRRHLGAVFNGPKFTERYGLNSGQDVLAATSLPELRDLEAGASGYAVVPLDVKAPLKNFEAESQTYDTGFPKAGPSGRSKYPSPYQLIYRDTLNWMKENPSANKSSEFGRMNMIVPKQQIDDELIEAIGEYQRRMKELTGKKKGGIVKKAAGGAITGDDLIIEERPL